MPKLDYFKFKAETVNNSYSISFLDRFIFRHFKSIDVKDYQIFKDPDGEYYWKTKGRDHSTFFNGYEETKTLSNKKILQKIKSIIRSS